MTALRPTAVINVLLLGWVGTLPGMDALEVVARYEKTLQQYRSFDVVYSITFSWRPDLSRRCEWTYDPSGKERWRILAKTEVPASVYGNIFRGRSTKSSAVIEILMDYMYADGALYRLDDFNPHRRTSLTTMSQNQIGAAIWRRVEPDVTFMLARAELLLNQAFLPQCGPVRALSDELKEAIGLFGLQAVECVRETVANHDCWKVTYPYPGCIRNGNLEARGAKVALYFDPSVGWLLRKRFHSTTTVPSEVSEVRKFTTLPNGLWFPLELESKLTCTNGEVRTSIVTVERAVINEPIDEVRWEFRFPPGAEVAEGELSAQGQYITRQIHIVGDNGTFLKTYDMGSKEFQEYQMKKFKQYHLSATRSRMGIAASMIALLLVTLGGVALWRRRKNLTRIIGVAHQGTK